MQQSTNRSSLSTRHARENAKAADAAVQNFGQLESDKQLIRHGSGPVHNCGAQSLFDQVQAKLSLLESQVCFPVSNTYDYYDEIKAWIGSAVVGSRQISVKREVLAFTKRWSSIYMYHQS